MRPVTSGARSARRPAGEYAQSAAIDASITSSGQDYGNVAINLRKRRELKHEKELRRDSTQRADGSRKHFTNEGEKKPGSEPQRRKRNRRNPDRNTSSYLFLSKITAQLYIYISCPVLYGAWCNGSTDHLHPDWIPVRVRKAPPLIPQIKIRRNHGRIDF